MYSGTVILTHRICIYNLYLVCFFHFVGVHSLKIFILTWVLCGEFTNFIFRVIIIIIIITIVFVCSHLYAT